MRTTVQRVLPPVATDATRTRVQPGLSTYLQQAYYNKGPSRATHIARSSPSLSAEPASRTKSGYKNPHTWWSEYSAVVVYSMMIGSNNLINKRSYYPYHIRQSDIPMSFPSSLMSYTYFWSVCQHGLQYLCGWKYPSAEGASKKKRLSGCQCPVPGLPTRMDTFRQYITTATQLKKRRWIYSNTIEICSSTWHKLQPKLQVRFPIPIRDKYNKSQN